MKHLLFCVLATVLFCSCGKPAAKDSKLVETPAAAAEQQPAAVNLSFNADSAYAFVERQVAFGPRVPGTEAHRLCGDYLVETLERCGAVVHQQLGEAKLYDGKSMKLRNIIGQINPEAKRRILLCAHWDTRPFADQEANAKLWHTPIDGANDGASGVGVLLEMARVLNELPLSIGVDIVFFDLEDWGTPEFHVGAASSDSYCLGSQYWARSVAKERNKPEAGILLDMVGGRGARFYKEQISMYYAANVMDAVWRKAQELGFENYFIPMRGGAITDDHLYVNRLADIPCIDIIQQDLTTETGFAPYWHTMSDNMKGIDRTTLYVVGQTVLEYVAAYK